MEFLSILVYTHVDVGNQWSSFLAAFVKSFDQSNKSNIVAANILASDICLLSTADPFKLRLRCTHTNPRQKTNKVTTAVIRGVVAQVSVVILIYFWLSNCLDELCCRGSVEYTRVCQRYHMPLSI